MEFTHDVLESIYKPPKSIKRGIRWNKSPYILGIFVFEPSFIQLGTDIIINYWHLFD